LQKGVQIWLYNYATFLLILSMFGFIAASAGYFPDMVASGAVDILISKPVRRIDLFIGKYLGGMALYAAVAVICYTTVLVGIGIRTGVWHFSLFGALPITLFSVALLYAFVACVGVLTRSSLFALVLAYLFYLVVDTALSILQSTTWFLGSQYDILIQIEDWTGLLYPGFRRLMLASGYAVLDIPLFEVQPLVVGTVWLVALLGIAYAWFRTQDF
jgi:ABC-type transport system involved in multi-copper enzyme maturation permease subunit